MRDPRNALRTHVTLEALITPVSVSASLVDLNSKPAHNLAPAVDLVRIELGKFLNWVSC